ncbi:MAG: Vitamin K epoxide reductase [Parcubacteria group bacterium GW2011_GWF2_38_76]|nr:MAG: Vitamin K epoxide reductase [Parcubacteria group bacterium GW2011_GWF2_38_76]HBM45698.1 hypothetical protein [Patescibacteria group bacterium]
MNKLNQIFWVFVFVVVVLSFAWVAFVFAIKPQVKYSNLDEFAKCLTDKGATMYGAAWCPHCLDEKSSFGSSFKYVNYVECPDNISLCTEKGIMGYPSWISAEGKILEGKQGLEKLSEITGCELKK